jgi:hypothetical protein
MSDGRRFKATWPRTPAKTLTDLDLKRPGQIDTQLAKRLARGAVPGPPARPGRSAGSR